MGRGALTLFPVCAGGRGTGRRSRPSLRLGRRPPCGGTAGALRAPAAPPTRFPASAPAFFRITLPPPPPQPPASRRHTGRRPSRPRRGGFRRASPAAAAAPPGLRPSPPTLAQPPPHPANSPKISHETIPTKIQILYKSVPQSPPFVNFP